MTLPQVREDDNETWCESWACKGYRKGEKLAKGVSISCYNLSSYSVTLKISITKTEQNFPSLVRSEILGNQAPFTKCT